MTTHALLVAKVPVPGQAKTRLGAEIGMVAAAELAAAAFLDTVEACEEAFPGRCHLALAGDLAASPYGADLTQAVAAWEVFAQEGASFGERLAHAHARVSAPCGALVVQVGMDTPQVTAQLLTEVAELANGPDAAVLGPAADGGWWVLGLRRAKAAGALTEVAMSRPDTGAETERALRSYGLQVVSGPRLVDVDTLADARAVAEDAPGTRFARSWRLMERVS